MQVAGAEVVSERVLGVGAVADRGDIVLATGDDLILGERNVGATVWRAQPVDVGGGFETLPVELADDPHRHADRCDSVEGFGIVLVLDGHLDLQHRSGDVIDSTQRVGQFGGVEV